VQRPWCTVISDSSLRESQISSLVPNQGSGCRSVGQGSWRKQSCQFSACWAKAQTLLCPAASKMLQVQSSHL